MTDFRWQYLKKYQGGKRHEMLRIDNDLRSMGFDSPIQALHWFVDEFQKGSVDKIYGCGPCCNDFIFPFIKKLENLCKTDINDVVSSRFDSLSKSEKQSIIDSYNWFFIPKFNDDGREKINRLEASLSHTDFFREIQARKIASDEKERLGRLKSSHLQEFSAKEAELVGKIEECRQHILRQQSEIAALETQIQNVRNAKEREWDLYQFERLGLDEQIKTLIKQTKPLAYYECRISKLIDEYDFSLLPKELIEKLFVMSKTAKPSKLPQIAKLHKILKQKIDEIHDQTP